MISQFSAADWSSGKKSGFVSIDSHSLLLKVSGPTRRPGDPVVIIECGTRTSATPGRQSSASESSETPRTAENLAQELLSLLRKAKIEPPYVLIGHSYGGILVREFLALLGIEQMLASMVLVDTVQEKSDIEAPWPMPQLIAVLGNLDRYEVIGLEDTQRLIPKEWEEVKSLESKEGYAITAARESEQMSASELALARKRQMDVQILGNKQLSAVKGNSARDTRMIYEAGLIAGNGTLEDRRVLKAFVDGLDDVELNLQRAQLSLSSDSGHNIHLQQPEIIAQEVRWVLKM